MNYVFLDTNIWLYFATGKNSEAKSDYSNRSIDLLDQIEELVKKKNIKLFLFEFSKYKRLSLQFPKLRVSEVANLRIAFSPITKQLDVIQQIEAKEFEIENDILGIKRKIKLLLS